MCASCGWKKHWTPGRFYDRTAVAIPAAMNSGELNDVVWEIGAKRLCKWWRI